MHTTPPTRPKLRFTTRRLLFITSCCGLFLTVAAWWLNSIHNTRLLFEEHESVTLRHIAIEGRGRRVEIADSTMLADWSTGLATSAKGKFYTDEWPDSGRYLVYLWYRTGGRHVFFAEFFEDDFLIEASIELDEPLELAIETRQIRLTPRSETNCGRIFRFLNGKDGSVRGSVLRLNEDGSFTQSDDPSLW